MEKKKIKLKVLEAYTRDVGRGVVRLDYKNMDEMEISTGDFVTLIGSRRTLAKVTPLYPSDEGKEIIRIDSLQRNNIGVQIGQQIIIEPFKNIARLSNVTVHPLEAIPPIDERYIVDALEGMAVTKGDNVLIPYFGGRITFQVISTLPIEGGIIIDSTIAKISKLTETEFDIEAKVNILRSELKQKFAPKLKEILKSNDLDAILKVLTEYKNEKVLQESKIDLLKNILPEILTGEPDDE